MLTHKRLSDEDCDRLRHFLQSTCGIKMPPNKKVMLEARLNKRLRALRLESMEAYCSYIFGEAGQSEELVHLIDVVTTNKTEFFREPQSFTYLAEVVLPALLRGREREGRRLRFWSAACSTGEEPYTLAMMLEEYRRTYPHQQFDYGIVASDISTRVLETAQRAIYPLERTEPIPPEVSERYLMRSRDASRPVVRIVPELRERVRFVHLNLMEPFSFKQPIDVILCRNVIIYFDRATQMDLLTRMCQALSPEGYLVMGHSETLNGLPLPVRSVAPMIYRRSS